MTTLAVALVLAQNSQEAPKSGVGIGLILGAVLLFLLVVAGIFFVLTRSTRASRGGVEAPRRRRRRRDGTPSDRLESGPGRG
jgi:hypothetical protein